MNTPSTDELMTESNNHYVSMWEALERLHRNEDFKKVILDGYFRDEAQRGVSILATDHVVRNGLRSEVMEGLIAISRLQDYLGNVENMGNIPPEDEE